MSDTPNTSFIRCGRIHFGGSHFRLPCVVKALSRDAAHLHVFGAEKLPEHFWLYIESIHMEFECEVTSRSRKTVFVAIRVPSQNRDALEASELNGDFRSRDELSNLRTPAMSNVTLPRLWVVEDDPDDCAILSDAFQQQNFLCDMKFFIDGQEFLDYLGSTACLSELSNPPLTLLDINMPRVDGITTLSRLRCEVRFRHLPVAVFTTSNQERDIERSYMLGVSAYITKPSREEDFKDVVAFVKGYCTVGAKFPRQDVVVSG